MVHMLKAGGGRSSAELSMIALENNTAPAAGVVIDLNNNNTADENRNLTGLNRNWPSVPLPPPPSQPATHENTTEPKNTSPESSEASQQSFQFCRICHEGDTSCRDGISPSSCDSSNPSSSSERRSGEPLIAPCRCTGSVAMVHLSCLEHWLTTSSTEKCELCHYEYKTRKTPRPWSEFLTDSNNQFNVRNMIADIVCFFLLTPLLMVSTYLCAVGAHQYYYDEKLEACALVFLGVFLVGVYFIWCDVTLKYHIGVWKKWRRTRQRIFVTFGDTAAGLPDNASTSTSSTDSSGSMV